jgi:MFS family permease
MAAPKAQDNGSPPSEQGRDATEHTPLLANAGQFAHDADTETTALIGAATADRPHDDSPGAIPDSGKPLPKLQIFLLCYVRMMEPIAFFSIFPFIAQMILRNGDMPLSDVGFYSGLIESLFSATQTLVLISWGRLADRIGRKPVLIYSLVGMAIGPVLFGMSRTIWQMILFRCLAGIFSGSTLVIRTMIAEHSTRETQARAFSWFAFGGNLGIFVGPLIGGALADPVAQYPGAFKGIGFFEEYPYALAGFVVGGISATGVIVSILFLEETLPKVDKPDSASPNGSSRQEAQKMSMWDILKAPSVGFVLWLYSHIMLLAFMFTAIIPVAAFTSIELGGLGLTTQQISMYMAVQGACQALWLLVAFPWLQHRMGTKGVMKICGVAYPFFFLGYIVLNLFLRDGGHTAMVWFWIIGAIVLFVGPGVSMAFTGAQLALNDVSPDTRVLGTLNAIALTGSCAIRSVIPAISTTIYALGVRNQILKGQLAWVILIPLAMVFTVGARWLPEDKKRKPQAADEES